MAIGSGFLVHDQGVETRYRVPDLLTKREFQVYMASNFGVMVEFRPLTDEEVERLNSNEPLVHTRQEPSATDAEMAALREKLGLVDIENALGITHEPGSRVYDLDHSTLTADQLKEKYGTVYDPKPPEEPTTEEPDTSEVDESGENDDDGVPRLP